MSANLTYFYDLSGQRIFPCVCGETHKGPYAYEDWAHHNCRHEEGFWRSEQVPEQLVCVLCGAARRLVNT